MSRIVGKIGRFDNDERGCAPLLRAASVDLRRVSHFLVHVPLKPFAPVIVRRHFAPVEHSFFLLRPALVGRGCVPICLSREVLVGCACNYFHFFLFALRRSDAKRREISVAVDCNEFSIQEFKINAA